MTRINIGVEPVELCDKMLFASYRELPRMVSFANKRFEIWNHTGPRPTLPTLGTGHQAYFLPYGQSLKLYQEETVREIRRRGFNCNDDVEGLFANYPQIWFDIMPLEHINLYRPIIRARVKERLLQMETKPKWTKSTRPDW